jgi:nucleoside-diphosphate-sugar epimerase
MKTDTTPSILVTGAGGFIGRRLVNELLTRGYRVRCMVRKPTDLPAGVEQLQGDLLKPDSLSNRRFRIFISATIWCTPWGQGKGDFAEQRPSGSP